MAIRQNGDRAPGTGAIEAAVTDAPTNEEAIARVPDIASAPPAGTTIVIGGDDEKSRGAYEGMARGLAALTAEEIRLADRARAAIAELGGSPDWPVWSTYTEPSLVFSLGTETRLAEFSALPALLPDGGEPYITIEDVSRSGDDPDALAALDRGVCAARELPGFNYSRGDETVLIVRLHNCPEANP